MGRGRCSRGGDEDAGEGDVVVALQLNNLVKSVTTASERGAGGGYQRLDRQTQNR